MTIQLPQPTHDTLTLIQHATRAVAQLYRPGYGYKKAGVLLANLSPAAAVQGDLFSHPARQQRQNALMETVDGLNQRYGAKAVFCAAEGIGQGWRMRAGLKSPRFTTRWGELVGVE